MADRNTASEDQPEFADQRALYEQLESQTAQAFEQFVYKPSFGVLLARTGENVAAISKIVSDSADLALRKMEIIQEDNVLAVVKDPEKNAAKERKAVANKGF